MQVVIADELRDFRDGHSRMLQQFTSALQAYIANILRKRLARCALEQLAAIAGVDKESFSQLVKNQPLVYVFLHIFEKQRKVAIAAKIVVWFVCCQARLGRATLLQMKLKLLQQRLGGLLFDWL